MTQTVGGISEGFAGVAQKTALITGANGGVGRAVASKMRAAGFSVVGGMRDVADRNRTAAEELRRSGIGVVEMDVGCDQSVVAGVAETLRLLDHIDVLVNNAGYALNGALEAVSSTELMRQLDVNVAGAHRVTRAVLPGMRQRREGLIVMVSSGVGRYVTPGLGAYASSKWALEALSDALRLELHAHGVDSVILELGPFRSGFEESSRTVGDTATAGAYPEVEEVLARASAAWRANPSLLADPAEIGAALVELAALPFGSRPGRLVLHPERAAIEEYNNGLALLQRHIAQRRGFSHMLQ